VGFLQWTGSDLQKEGLERIKRVSDAFHALRQQTEKLKSGSNELNHHLHEAHWRLLRAETSCNLYWGEAWVPRLHADLNEAEIYLRKAEIALGKPSAA
jgi:hypothetical protein